MTDLGMTRVVETYRRIPVAVAFVLSAIVAGALAILAGVAGGMFGIYLYDRGMSKGNDLAVGMTGLSAVGTFVFVTAFAWLTKLHHKISWRTPAFALAFCLAVVAVITGLMWDSNYSGFILVGWIVISFSSLLAFNVSRRSVSREPAWEEKDRFYFRLTI
jgi:hypothetical protein